MEKTVLVHVGERIRPVSFSGGNPELSSAIKLRFQDILTGNEVFFIQVKSEVWGGVFVDVLPDQNVDDKDQIKVVVCRDNEIEPARKKLDIEAGPKESQTRDTSQETTQSVTPAKQLHLITGNAGLLTLESPSVDTHHVVDSSREVPALVPRTTSLHDDEIRELAVIYRKETNRKLSNYHKKMNEAAQNMCLKNPSLLQQRSVLIEKARLKIIEDGFQFVKGKSRSKRLLKKDEPANTVPAGAQKQKRLSKEIRAKRLSDIQEDYKDLSDRILFKEKRMAAHENVRDYKKCDELLEEISALKKQRRTLQSEEKQLLKSISQSKWYFKKKMAARNGSHSDSMSDTMPARSWYSPSPSELSNPATPGVCSTSSYSNTADSPSSDVCSSCCTNTPDIPDKIIVSDDDDDSSSCTSVLSSFENDQHPDDPHSDGQSRVSVDDQQHF